MNTQAQLSELDALRRANLQLRRQVLQLEEEAFTVHLIATYGNPGETLSVHPDGTLVRGALPQATEGAT